MRADGTAFLTDSVRSPIAPRENGDVAHPHEAEHRFFALSGGCVVRCLPYHARSFY